MSDPLNPADVEEVLDADAPSYAVRFETHEYAIYSPELDDTEGQSWGRAAYALFSIVNSQMSSSTHRFYAFYGGNDLGGMFLTPQEAEAARSALPSPYEWPYIPTLEHPYYGQHH